MFLGISLLKQFPAAVKLSLRVDCAPMWNSDAIIWAITLLHCDAAVLV